MIHKLNDSKILQFVVIDNIQILTYCLPKKNTNILTDVFELI